MIDSSCSRCERLIRPEADRIGDYCYNCASIMVEQYPTLIDALHIAQHAMNKSLDDEHFWSVRHLVGIANRRINFVLNEIKND